MPSSLRRSFASLAVAGASVALLAGCSLFPSTGPASPTGGPDDVPPTATPTDTASATPLPTVTGTPITAKCGDLISADTIYAYNPNIVPLGAFTPDAGTSAATAVGAGGIACRYQNQTSSQNIDLAVADLDAASLTTIKGATTGDPVSGMGDSAFFATSGGVGTLTVFKGTYWATLSSPFFLGADDATDLVTSVLAGLPA